MVQQKSWVFILISFISYYIIMLLIFFFFSHVLKTLWIAQIPAFVCVLSCFLFLFFSAQLKKPQQNRWCFQL